MNRWLFGFSLGFMMVMFRGTAECGAAQSIGEIYSMYQNLDMGDPKVPRHKDYYVTLGSGDGLKKDSHLTVVRKIASSDAMTQKFYQDLVFPIATLRVIHVQKKVAIARLIEMIPLKDSPVISPYALMVGDHVVLK